MSWIKRRRAKFAAQQRQSERAYVSGESHHFLGRRYRLRLIEGSRAGRVQPRSTTSLDLHARSGSDLASRERLLLAWYRQELRRRGATLIEKWSEKMEAALPLTGIRRMKIKWGTRNVEAGRIWLNLELIKKPPACREYIVGHELTRFLERKHSGRFVATMVRLLPKWRLLRDELNAEPLAHDEW